MRFRLPGIRRRRCLFTPPYFSLLFHFIPHSKFLIPAFVRHMKFIALKFGEMRTRRSMCQLHQLS